MKPADDDRIMGSSPQFDGEITLMAYFLHKGWRHLERPTSTFCSFPNVVRRAHSYASVVSC
jgi:hypothetical protein